MTSAEQPSDYIEREILRHCFDTQLPRYNRHVEFWAAHVLGLRVPRDAPGAPRGAPGASHSMKSAS
jgi:hypothetical protein